jgi:hypothetical protein
MEALLRNTPITSYPSNGIHPQAQGSNIFPSYPTQAHLQQGTSSVQFSQQSTRAGAALHSSSTSQNFLHTEAQNSPKSSNSVYLELCVNAGRFLKTLGEIDLSTITTDGDFFSTVKEHYLRLRSFRTKFWLLKPSSVSYVRVSRTSRHQGFKGIPALANTT